MSLVWNYWILIYSFLFIPRPGLSIYFTEKRVVRTLFGQRPDLPLFQVESVLEPDEDGIISYGIYPLSDPAKQCPPLRIRRNQIYLEEKNYSIAGGSHLNCSYALRGELTGKVGSRGAAHAQTTLSLITNYKQGNCSTRSPEELCWAGNSRLDIEVMENSREVLGAWLGFQLNSCETGIRVDYEMNMNSGNQDLFYIGHGAPGFSPFSFRIKKGLDRERRDEYNFSLSCHISGQDGKLFRESTIPGKVTVLDQNDNIPTSPRGDQRVNVSFSLKNSHNKYEPHHRLIQESRDLNSLLFTDLDTKDVNKFELILSGDELKLFNISVNVSQFPTSNGTQFTVVRFLINLSSRIDEIHPWTGLYCVQAKFQDMGIILSLKSKAAMVYRICIHWANSATVWEKGTGFGLGEEKMTEKNGSASQQFPFLSPIAPVGTELSRCDEVCLIGLSIGITFVTLLVVWSCWVFKSRVSKKIVERSGRMGLLGGTEGSPDGHQLTIADPDYILPNTQNGHANYGNLNIDSKWEISREALILEEVLGVGEFGRVFKGRTNVNPGKEGIDVVVAVKMLKDNSEETGKSCREEFLSEFSLLQQLDHPNVIKLLGACTAPGGPLYLVMEYAELGSLRTFLRKCRRVESLSNDLSGKIEVKETDQKDYDVNPREILQFSWQIAKGMSYLSDMKMVHRDLAARNVLLTRRRICKISDFGLTRDIYVDEAYQKKSRDRVPVKWLAPESLADEVYTKKSDVWSFGILLWELATLGSSPYPGIPAEKLYTLLKTGYRMPCPPNASHELYSLMRQCWALDPRDRPTFRLLGASLGKLLEDGLEYLKLDLPLVSNPGYAYFSATEELLPLKYESQNQDATSSEVESPSNSGKEETNLPLSHTYVNATAPGFETKFNESVEDPYESPISVPSMT